MKPFGISVQGVGSFSFVFGGFAAARVAVAANDTVGRAW